MAPRAGVVAEDPENVAPRALGASAFESRPESRSNEPGLIRTVPAELKLSLLSGRAKPATVELPLRSSDCERVLTASVHQGGLTLTSKTSWPRRSGS